MRGGNTRGDRGFGFGGCRFDSRRERNGRRELREMNIDGYQGESETDDASSMGEGVHVFDDGKRSFWGEGGSGHGNLEEVDTMELTSLIDIPEPRSCVVEPELSITLSLLD